MTLITAVITSAGIAALVSGMVAIVGQCLERSARRNELIFEKAIEMSYKRTELVMDAIKLSGGKAKLHDNLVLSEGYYRLLSHLFKHGELPKDPSYYKMTEIDINAISENTGK